MTPDDDDDKFARNLATYIFNEMSLYFEKPTKEDIYQMIKEFQENTP